MHGVKFSLSGEIQTVPRGEIFALVRLLEKAAHLSCIHYVTDNLGLYDTYHAGPNSGYRNINCDLYSKIYSLIFEKAIQLSVTWMPSHLDTKTERPAHVMELDIQGNAHADTHCKDMARIVCVPLNVSAPVLYYYAIIKRIQHRLATILINLPHRDRPHKVRCPRHVFPLASAIADSTHVLFAQGNRQCCARCRSSFHVGDPHIKKWLATSCTAIGQSHDKPVPVCFDSIHLGRNNTHATHKLYVFRGLVFCNKCGMRSATQLNKLSKPCLPPTPYGEATIKSINACRLPYKVSRWPDGS